MIKTEAEAWRILATVRGLFLRWFRYKIKSKPTQQDYDKMAEAKDFLITQCNVLNP